MQGLMTTLARISGGLRARIVQRIAAVDLWRNVQHSWKKIGDGECVPFICPVTRLNLQGKNKRPFAAISEVGLVRLPHIQMLSTSNFPSTSLTPIHPSMHSLIYPQGRMVEFSGLPVLRSKDWLRTRVSCSLSQLRTCK